MSSPLYRKIVAQSSWLNEQEARGQSIPDEWHCWLFDHGSLTAQLKAFSGDNFAVHVLSEKWGNPNYRESSKLGLSTGSEALIREVELVCNGQVVVFARSIIPQSLFAKESDTFESLGTKPLGHILFKGGGEQLNLRDISTYVGDDGSTVYGRSTPYRYQDSEILVSEFFVSHGLVKDGLVNGGLVSKA